MTNLIPGAPDGAIFSHLVSSVLELEPRIRNGNWLAASEDGNGSKSENLLFQASGISPLIRLAGIFTAWFEIRASDKHTLTTHNMSEGAKVK
jgi:hypothetical protein